MRQRWISLTRMDTVSAKNTGRRRVVDGIDVLRGGTGRGIGRALIS